MTDSSAGQSHSWRPHAPGSARKSARSGRALPSTYHYRGKTSSRTIKLRPPGDSAGAARGERWGGLIYGCTSILISRAINIILTLLRWKEFSLSGPSWLRVGGDAVTYSGLLWDNSSHKAFVVIWNRIQVIWGFEGKHVIWRVEAKIFSQWYRQIFFLNVRNQIQIKFTNVFVCNLLVIGLAARHLGEKLKNAQPLMQGGQMTVLQHLGLVYTVKECMWMSICMMQSIISTKWQRKTMKSCETRQNAFIFMSSELNDSSLIFNRKQVFVYHIKNKVCIILMEIRQTGRWTVELQAARAWNLSLIS